MYQKIIDNGYITGITSGCSNGNCTEEEYNAVMTTIHNRPKPPEGYGYKLKENLEWDMYELPPKPQPSDEDEISEYEITKALEAIL